MTVQTLNSFLSTVQTTGNGCSMVGILFRSNPFQITSSIIKLILINMVYLRLIVWVTIGTKSLRNKSMQSRLFTRTIAVQSNMRISRMLNDRLYENWSAMNAVRHG